MNKKREKGEGRGWQRGREDVGRREGEEVPSNKIGHWRISN